MGIEPIQVSSMSEVSQALQKIARGTGIVFAGTIISMFFGFLSRVIIARFFSRAEYGVFNLALTILSVALVIATIGFQNSLPREVVFYKEKDSTKVGDLISTALLVVGLNSLIWMVVIILGAGNIGKVFDEMRLVSALRIVALALPFSALTGIMISVSRGFERVREQVYFQSIVYPTVFLVLVLAGVLLSFPFTFMFFAYVFAQAFTLLALTFDVWEIKLFRFNLSFDLKLGKELVVFSLPLLFAGILGFLMTWADTLMLGYYRGSEIVGIYNAASPIAKFLPIFLSSAGILYSPIATSLFAQGKIGEMSRIYQILTKWVFLLTLPLFVPMLLFPEVTINFFFGPKYFEASTALQILALGFMFHTFLGLNGLSLVVIGETKLNFIGDFFAAISNIIINALLIPRYGLEGAAIATAFSYLLANIFRSYWLYKKTRIHPFTWNYVKLLVISFFLLEVVKALHLRILDIWNAALSLTVFLAIYFFLVVLSRSVDEEDVELLLAIEKKLGIDLGLVKKILKKFL